MRKTNSELTPERVWKRYHDGLGFNARLNLDKEVETNENFFIGRRLPM